MNRLYNSIWLFVQHHGRIFPVRSFFSRWDGVVRSFPLEPASTCYTSDVVHLHLFQRHVVPHCTWAPLELPCSFLCAAGEKKYRWLFVFETLSKTWNLPTGYGLWPMHFFAYRNYQRQKLKLAGGLESASAKIDQDPTIQITVVRSDLGLNRMGLSAISESCDWISS
jgi:hypothetical protein